MVTDRKYPKAFRIREKLAVASEQARRKFNVKHNCDLSYTEYANMALQFGIKRLEELKQFNGV